MSYSAASAASFFDEYGEREWERFDRPGDRALDAGCGPGGAHDVGRHFLAVLEVSA